MPYPLVFFGRVDRHPTAIRPAGKVFAESGLGELRSANRKHVQQPNICKLPTPGLKELHGLSPVRLVWTRVGTHQWRQAALSAVFYPVDNLLPLGTEGRGCLSVHGRHRGPVACCHNIPAEALEGGIVGVHANHVARGQRRVDAHDRQGIGGGFITTKHAHAIGVDSFDSVTGARQGSKIDSLNRPAAFGEKPVEFQLVHQLPKDIDRIGGPEPIAETENAYPVDSQPLPNQGRVIRIGGVAEGLADSLTSDDGLEPAGLKEFVDARDPQHMCVQPRLGQTNDVRRDGHLRHGHTSRQSFVRR